MEPRLDPAALVGPDADVAQASASAWWQRQQDRVSDLAWATRFQAACPVPGQPVSAYLQAVLRGPPGEALVGLRFLGGDVRRPFVDLIAWDGPLAPWLAPARAHYAAFAPERVRVRWPGAEPPDGVEARVDQWVVAGRPAAGPTPGLQLEPAPPEVAVAWAREALTAWAARDPWRAGRVLPLDLGMARSAAAAQGLVWMVASGQRAGLLAVAPGTEREWTGWWVLEAVVAPAFAGRGLGWRSQRALAARLQGGPWIGTIDGANAASLASAARAGRHRVGAWWWVTGAGG